MGSCSAYSASSITIRRKIPLLSSWVTETFTDKFKRCQGNNEPKFYLMGKKSKQWSVSFLFKWDFLLANLLGRKRVELCLSRVACGYSTLILQSPTSGLKLEIERNMCEFDGSLRVNDVLFRHQLDKSTTVRVQRIFSYVQSLSHIFSKVCMSHTKSRTDGLWCFAFFSWI